MNVTKHELIQTYLQEIHEQLGISSHNSNLWAQIQEDILEHVQDAYDNWDSEDTQNVSLIINSILHELGSPPTIARAYLASNPDPVPETNKRRFIRRTKKLKRIPRYFFTGLTYPLRKTFKFIRIHKKIMIPYLIIMLTLYSALFMSQSSYHDEHTEPLQLIDSLGRHVEESYWEFIDIEIVNDHLLILDENYPESHLYFYEITEYKDPIHRATIDLGWEASSMKIFDNLVYVLYRNLNYNSDGSMYEVNVYNITDFSDVRLVGNYSSAQIPDLGYDAEIAFVKSSQLIHFDSKNIYFHALANQTEISFLSRHNITWVQ